jgi:hypothetical protein
MKNLFSIDKDSEHRLDRAYKINLFLITMMIVVLIYVSTQRIFIKTAKLVSNEPSKRDFCELIMNQMIHKKLSKKLMKESLYEQVVANNYGVLLFSGKEKLTGIWSGQNKCKVIVRGDGLRSFDFFLEESNEHPFYFEVFKITENDLFEGEV